MSTFTDLISGLRVLGTPDTYATAANNFQRGLGVLGTTYQNQGLGAAAGQLYGAAGDAFKTGAGVNDFNATTQAFQNLGASPGLARGLAAVGQSTADTLNPLGYVGGAVGANALGDLARIPAVRNFVANEGMAPPLDLSRLGKIVGADKVATAISAEGGGINPSLLGVRNRLLSSPDFPAFMSEIPAGSRYAGSGGEAVTLRTPAGDTVKQIEFAKGLRNQAAPPPRPDIPEMLPASSSNVYGNTRVETAPFAQVGDPAAESAAKSLADQIKARGLDPWDVNAPNVGKVGGRWFVIDRGAVR
jgi:hypothetical protein